MPRSPTADEFLFAPLSPSAIARGVAAEAADEVAEGRVALEAIARSVSAAPVPAGLRGRIMASAVLGGRYGKYADRIARMFDVSLDDARALLVRAEDPASFGPGPVPNTTWLFIKPGPRFAGALAAIGRLEPGAAVPDHAHGGGETTLVLEGGFVEDGSGEEVWRGDELFKPEGSAHSFRVIGDAPCVAAVIALGGVKFG